MLVFAELGFSMLTSYAQKMGVPPSAIAAFVDEVNRRDEVGTLMPLAPISAMPRRAVRDSTDPALVQRFVEESLGAIGAGLISCERIIIHLATPALSRHARRGIDAALATCRDRRTVGGTSQVVIATGV